jgi:hypothetical protein
MRMAASACALGRRGRPARLPDANALRMAKAGVATLYRRGRAAILPPPGYRGIAMPIFRFDISHLLSNL